MVVLLVASTACGPGVSRAMHAKCTMSGLTLSRRGTKGSRPTRAFYEISLPSRAIRNVNGSLGAAKIVSCMLTEAGRTALLLVVEQCPRATGGRLTRASLVDLQRTAAYVLVHDVRASTARLSVVVDSTTAAAGRGSAIAGVVDVC